MPKAVRFDEYGGVEVLQVRDVERVEPGPGRVRAIHAGLQAGGLYDVDASYVLVTQQGDAHYFALLDRYVIELEAGQVVERRGRDRLPESESLDSYTLKTAMDVVVANARSQLGTEE